MKATMPLPKKIVTKIQNCKITYTVLIAIIISLLISACAINRSSFKDDKLIVGSTDESSIAYGVSGQGDTTLIFVHGWLCDHSFWQHQIAYFSNKYKVVWLDLAGHGGSKTNRKKFKISTFAQDVKSVFEKVDGKKVILIGHSMGGPIVIETAKLLGENVIGIVGVDAFYTQLASVPESVKLGFLEKLKENYPDALAQTVDSMFSENANSDLIVATYQKMLSADHNMGISSLYECIKWNAHKEQIELKNFANKLRNINGSPSGNEKVKHKSVTLIKGVGHFVNKVKPNEFNSALEMIIENFETH